MQVNKNIDKGRSFDWGMASSDYAQYRDIYPDKFYEKIIELGLCTKGQRVLDLGTGTGVLPRALYKFGAEFTGADISANQIEQARILSQKAGMNIDYIVSPAENVALPDNSLDTVTACQCFIYFDTGKVIPNIHRMLKAGGRFAVMFMAWLPEENKIAGASEELVLKYNPFWTGCGIKRTPVSDPKWAGDLFETESKTAFDVEVPFTRESWAGRMRSCRGIDASLTPEKVIEFNKEHMALLENIAPEQFTITHYVTMLVVKAIK